MLKYKSEWCILPQGTCYFHEPVPMQGRQGWHRRARFSLADVDLVFLDPDTGFEVKSMTRTTAPKYSFYSEAVDWLRAGKTVIAIQFARQCDPIERGRDVRARLYQDVDAGPKQPIIRARLAPNILFLTFSPVGKADALQKVLKSFVHGAPQYRGKKIVEMIT